MNFKTIIAFASVALALASCSKEETGPNTKEGTTSVQLVITQQGGVRSEGGAIATGTLPTFTDGYVYFVDATETITKVLTISAEGTGEDNLNLGELTSPGGASAIHIPDNSRTVYLVSNLPDSYVNLVEGQTSADIRNSVINVNEMSDPTGGVTAVPLYGSGAIDTDQEPARAVVEVAAIASRIEISEIRNGDGEVTDFEVVGIFVNNFYMAQTIAGSTADYLTYGSDPLNSGSSVEYYDPEHASGFYSQVNEGVVYDWYDPANSSQSAVVTPQNSEVWAYNVFPGVNAEAEADNLPHIIIILNNIVLSDGTNVYGKRYLTLDTFRKTGDTESLDKFEKGKIYTISSVSFNKEDLDIAPEIDPVSVNVEVTLLPWTTQPIEWVK